MVLTLEDWELVWHEGRGERKRRWVGLGEGQIVVWAGAAVEAWEASEENGERSRRERK